MSSAILPVAKDLREIMARGELLRKLILSHNSGIDDEFRAAALEIAAEEQKKNNHQLAQDLLRLINGRSNSTQKPLFDIKNLPKDRERQTVLLDMRAPVHAMQDVLLTTEQQNIVQRVIDEYRKKELLATHALEPIQRILFCGPPGCGKTVCTEAIAHELGLPILYTRFDAIVSSYLGETAANLRKIFDYASSGQWILFFDEFDAIGKSRDDKSEHGELKRVINSFLQLLDGHRIPGLLIAATNHEHLLDLALWRRFDEIVLFPLPAVGAIRVLLQMKLKNFPTDKLNLNRISQKLVGLSHADIEHICVDAIKTCILQDEPRITANIFNRSIVRQQQRQRIANHTKSS